MKSPHTRRQFLKTTTAAGVAMTLPKFRPGLLQGAEAFPVSPPLTPSWIDRPMRWAQLTLVEDDPGRFDLAFWLDYFRRTHSDAACLSAGGCVGYYPPEVPLPHRSQWLGDPRPLRQIVPGGRQLGMTGPPPAPPPPTRALVPPGPMRGGRTSCGRSSAASSSGGCGTRRSARSTPTPA